MFTPLRIAFGLAILPIRLYLLILALTLTPVVVMEIAKLFGNGK